MEKKKIITWSALLLLFLTTACSSSSGSDPVPSAAPSASSTATASASPTATASAAPEAAARTYQNPLPVKPVADPFVLRASNGTYYMYPTSSGVHGFKVWSSPDLVNWKAEGTAYSSGANAWDRSLWWAPEVTERDGKYYMYFSAQNGDGNKRIGVAVSDKPQGPFHDAIGHPLMDRDAIDAHVFTDDDGQSYLYYSGTLKSNPDKNGKKESFIYGIKLGKDGLSVQGEPVLLLKPEQAWETGGQNDWNEGPAMLKHDGSYYLMYSANCYCNKNYGIGYAKSKSPLGPFAKYENNPVMSSVSTNVSGSGHHAVVKSPDNSELWIVYHTHIDPNKGGGSRQLNVDRMGFRADGTIYVDGPTFTKQPSPSGVGGVKNIGLQAKAQASGTRQGFSADALNDGEIGMAARNAAGEWETDANKPGAWAELSWDAPHKIDSVWIYNSSSSDQKAVKGHLVLDDGTVIKDIQLGQQPGEAATVNIQGKTSKSIRFVIDEMKGDKAVGLSEIMVFGE